VEGGLAASAAEATPVVSFIPKIVMILPGATLPEDREAALTTRKFWAERVIEITHNNVAACKAFIYPPLTFNGSSVRS
jgi:hypothetical protein